LQNGDLFIDQPRFIEDWQQVEDEIITVIQRQVRRFAVRLWIFSAGELKALLSDAGFKRVRIYGNLDGYPADQMLPD